VLLVTFVFTVAFDLVTAIAVGILFASLLFMKRMADVTEVSSWKYIEEEGENSKDSIDLKPVPKHVAVFEVSGPMFFGAAQKFSQLIIDERKTVLILRMRSVPAMDATALKSLEKLHQDLKKKHVTLILSHVNEQPMSMMNRAGFLDLVGRENLAGSIDEALSFAVDL
jgi:SulP family sulfate permease